MEGGLSDTILKDEHPRAIPDKIGLIWFSGIREEDLNAKAYEVHRAKWMDGWTDDVCQVIAKDHMALEIVV